MDSTSGYCIIGQRFTVRCHLSSQIYEFRALTRACVTFIRSRNYLKSDYNVGETCFLLRINRWSFLSILDKIES